MTYLLIILTAARELAARDARCIQALFTAILTVIAAQRNHFLRPSRRDRDQVS